MNAQYVVVVHDPNGPAQQGLIGDLKAVIPEVQVLETRGDVVLLECPVYEEFCLFDFFKDRHCVISRNRTYSIKRARATEGESNGNA